MAGDIERSTRPVFAGFRFPAVIYRSEEKVDLALEELAGVSGLPSITHTTSSRRDVSASIGAKTGDLLSLLGVGNVSAEAGVALSSESKQTTEPVSTFSSKLHQLVSGVGIDQVQHVDLYDGLLLSPVPGAPVPTWPAQRIYGSSTLGSLVSFYGIFEVRAVRSETGDFYRDVTSRATALWEFVTVAESALHARIPFWAERLLLGSQHTVIGLIEGANRGEVHLQVFGVVVDGGDSMVCDALTIQYLFVEANRTVESPSPRRLPPSTDGSTD